MYQQRERGPSTPFPSPSLCPQASEQLTYGDSLLAVYFPPSRPPLLGTFPKSQLLEPNALEAPRRVVIQSCGALQAWSTCLPPGPPRGPRSEHASGRVVLTRHGPYPQCCSLNPRPRFPSFSFEGLGSCCDLKQGWRIGSWVPELRSGP